MSNLVNLEAVRKAFGPTVLLDGVSLGVHAGDRIGVVGRNGAGKSTLLRILGRLDEPDAGRVTHLRDLRVGVLSQADRLDPAATIREAVLGSRAEHEWASDPGIRTVLAGLFGGLDLPGFADGLQTVIGPCSGGERRRIALARELIAAPDLLILDEPTNHLDVEGIAWLAGHLAGLPTALVVVTHDRWFLDAVCTRTWEVTDGAVHAYDGGYAAYVLAKAERSRIEAATEAKRANLARKELAWLRRGPPARTSKPRFRIEAANALIEGEPPARNAQDLVRFATARLGRTVYDLHGVSLRVGERALLDEVTWHLGPGDRVGLVGVNGSGKTSLLRLLLGEVAPQSGSVKVGKTVQAVHLSQEVAELDPAERVLTGVERVARVVRVGDREFSASSMLERFGFVGERQWARNGDLSGGERRRLQLLRLLMTEPNVILLDEPTNDLDIETLTQLEDLLDGWPGSLLVVSHDRYFLERTTDTVVALLGDGSLRMLPGGVEEYLRRRGEQGDAAPARVAEAAAGRGATPGAEQPTDGDRPRPSGAEVRAARKELARLERRLDRLSLEEQALHEKLAAHAEDYAKVAEFDAALRALGAERAELEEAWLLAAEAAEG